jgi:hypothetical protein
MKKYLIAVALLASTIVPAAQSRADSVEACSDATATMLPIAGAGVPIEIVGSQVTRTEMARLWEITTTRRDAYLYLGKIIGAGQNWFGACKFPGLGIATGSGWGIADYKNVTLWVWAAGVDIAIARESVYSLIADVVPATTTTTTTTTTTVAPTTTTIAATTTTEYVAPTYTEPAVALAVVTEVAVVPQSSGTVTTVSLPAEPIVYTVSVAARSAQVKAIPKKKAKKDEQRSRSRKRVCKARWVSCR